MAKGRVPLTSLPPPPLLLKHIIKPSGETSLCLQRQRNTQKNLREQVLLSVTPQLTLLLYSCPLFTKISIKMLRFKSSFKFSFTKGGSHIT